MLIWLANWTGYPWSLPRCLHTYLYKAFGRHKSNKTLYTNKAHTHVQKPIWLGRQSWKEAEVELMLLLLLLLMDHCWASCPACAHCRQVYVICLTVCRSAAASSIQLALPCRLYSPIVMSTFWSSQKQKQQLQRQRLSRDRSQSWKRWGWRAAATFHISIWII